MVPLFVNASRLCLESGCFVGSELASVEDQMPLKSVMILSIPAVPGVAAAITKVTLPPVPVPELLLTRTAPLLPNAATAMIFVLETIVKLAALVPPNETAVAFVKLVPLIVTGVLVVMTDGENEPTVGTWAIAENPDNKSSIEKNCSSFLPHEVK